MKHLLALVAIGLNLGGCYVARQALSFNSLYNSRVPVEAVLHDPMASPRIKSGLALTRELLNFAGTQGLNVESSYRYFVQNDEGGVSFIVQAAESDRLKFVTWWFPFVGSVPYLGFFDRSERDAKARSLREKGYDVHVGRAEAFSSLGWFEDPIYASMLMGGEHDLAHTLLHELTHRTFWAQGSAEFNENLAEYAAQFLTVAFLKSKGREEEVQRYRAEREDKSLFRRWLGQLRDALEQSYALPDQALDMRQEAKRRIFEHALTNLPAFKTTDYGWIKGAAWNNATVLAAGLYSPDLARFERAHACTGFAPMGVFLSKLKAAEGKDPDGFDALTSLCAGEPVLDKE